MVLEEFQTSDIILAAYLRLQGSTMARIDKEGNKGTFVFTNVDDNHLQTFDFGNALVEPVAFNNMVKQLTTSVRRLSQ